MGKVFDECQSFACAIQSCLQKNDYQQDTCAPIIEQMLDCCELNADKNFPSCDGFKFMLNKRKANLAAKKEGTSTSKAN